MEAPYDRAPTPAKSQNGRDLRAAGQWLGLHRDGRAISRRLNRRSVSVKPQIEFRRRRECARRCDRFSFAVQHGANPEAIRRALSRDSRGNASGPLGAALDIIAAEKNP